MKIVKPFALAAGDYLELEDHRFVGPLLNASEDRIYTFGASHHHQWSTSGVPINGSPRIRAVIKGPVGINAYIDRMSGDADAEYAAFADEQISRARSVLRSIAGRATRVASAPEEPTSIGALADSTIQAMMTKIVTEVLLPEIRKIVAEEVEAMALNTRRYVLTLENYNERRG